MPRAVPVQTSFNAGEWSWPMFGRVDLPKYRNAVKQMRNMFPKVQGPAVRRGGTTYVSTIVTQSAKGRLIPFEFSVTQAYILLFENNTFRVYKDNGIVAGPVDVVTTYATADLPTLKYAQSADTLYIVHPSYVPRKVTRTSDTVWSIADIAFVDGPFLPVNATATTITPGATSGSTTWTASSTTGINDGTGFQTTDVGRQMRFKDSGNKWFWVDITARSSTTVVTGTAYQAGTNTAGTLTTTTASTDWRLGAWSGTTGYPRDVTFFQDRLTFAGEPSQTVHMSVSGDYENFKPSAENGTVVDDDAVTFTLNANDVNVIRWLSDDEKGLVIGTVGGEWLARASTAGEAITPTNVQATRSTSYGSANVQPIRADNATLFVQRAGFKLHEHAYLFEADGFRSPNLALFAEEITRSTSGGLTELAYQKEPDRIVWAVRADGRLCSMTYEREQDVVGWALHTIGGDSDANGTPAVVESIAVIPSATGDRDELWMIVKRWINGATKRYVEYMRAPIGENDDQEDAKYVDSGLTYDSTATTSISGLGHLEGETVTILADGATHATKTVSSGAITLDVSSSVVQVGYPFTSTLQTLNIEAGEQDGTAQGRTKRIDRVVVRFNRSLGGQCGPDTSNLDDIPDLTFRNPATLMGSPPALFTGDAAISFPSGYNTDGLVTIQTSDPLPMSISLISQHVVSNVR